MGISGADKIAFLDSALLCYVCNPGSSHCSGEAWMLWLFSPIPTPPLSLSLFLSPSCNMKNLAWSLKALVETA